MVLVAGAFAFADPSNNCVASQITNGLIIGIIYGFMALGLTLIFSILGIVSFSHGEFYMVGGILVYYITAVWLPGITPLLAIAMSCAIVFALGATIAALAGSLLVQAFEWLPQVGKFPAMRSFVIVVLGGLGSLPGAFVGGILVGLVEAAGTGCIPDPQKAASYIPAYGNIVLTLTLLLRPTGLFGRRFASGAHGKF